MEIYSAAAQAASTEIPAGLDPLRHRIICEHYFGVSPTALVAKRAASPVFQTKVRKLCRLGERAVGEFIAEIACQHSLEAEIDAALLRFGGIDPKALAAEVAGEIGADTAASGWAA